MYLTSRTPLSSDDLRSQNAIIARLSRAGGYRAEAVAEAISLLQTGAVDLIEDALAGSITVTRALKIAQQRSRR